MVFVSVSNDHTADFLTIFNEIGKIGNDDVDTKHLIVRERHPAVDDHQIILIFQDGDVLTNFV